MRPSVISLRTYDAGECVGYGPSVSVGATLQVPESVESEELLPDDELPEVVVVVAVSESFLQASANTEVDAAPIIRLFKKFFLSMAYSPLSLN